MQVIGNNSSGNTAAVAVSVPGAVSIEVFPFEQ